jgi:hypothetical protein
VQDSSFRLQSMFNKWAKLFADSISISQSGSTVLTDILLIFLPSLLFFSFLLASSFKDGLLAGTVCLFPLAVLVCVWSQFLSREPSSRCSH